MKDNELIEFHASCKLDSLSSLVDDYILKFVPLSDEKIKESGDDNRWFDDRMMSILVGRLLYHSIDIVMRRNGISTERDAWGFIKSVYDKDFEEGENIAVRLDNDPNCPYNRDGSLKIPNEETAQVLQDSENGIDVIEADNMDDLLNKTGLKENE